MVGVFHSLDSQARPYCYVLIIKEQYNVDCDLMSNLILDTMLEIGSIPESVSACVRCSSRSIRLHYSVIQRPRWSGSML